VPFRIDDGFSEIRCTTITLGFGSDAINCLASWPATCGCRTDTERMGISFPPEKQGDCDHRFSLVCHIKLASALGLSRALLSSIQFGHCMKAECYSRFLPCLIEPVY
jgi:hypothetical protein